MAKTRSPSKDHVFETHTITDEVVTDTVGSWFMRRPEDGVFACRITAASGCLIVTGDFFPIVFGHAGGSPRDVVKWIGTCAADDGYYPAQKAEIGMGIRIAKNDRANGIRSESVFLALAAVRRLHALLERRDINS